MLWPEASIARHIGWLVGCWVGWSSEFFWTKTTWLSKRFRMSMPVGLSLFLHLLLVPLLVAFPTFLSECWLSKFTWDGWGPQYLWKWRTTSTLFSCDISSRSALVTSSIRSSATIVWFLKIRSKSRPRMVNRGKLGSNWIHLPKAFRLSSSFLKNWSHLPFP